MSTGARTGDSVTRAIETGTSDLDPKRAPALRRSARYALRASDLLVVLLVAIVSSIVSSGISWLSPTVFVVSAMVWLEVFSLYRARMLSIRVDEWRRLTQALAAAFASVVVVGYLFDLEPPRLWLVATSAATFGLLAFTRELWRVRFTRLRDSGVIGRRTILVGANPEANMLADMLNDDASLGYDLVGRVDPTEFARPELLTTHVLSSVARSDASSALIAGSGVEVSALNRLCRDLVEAGVHVELSMSLIDIMHRRLTLRPLGRFPVAYLEPVRRDGWRPQAKRIFDIAASGLGLLVLSPVLLVLAAAVKFTSEGPVIFRQERVGRDGKSFDMLKFRSMVVDAEERLDDLRAAADPSNPLFKLRDDPRITRIGGVLRRTSLDELPQLINVLKGEMSLVGPRPALRSEMAAWSPELYGRLRVRPGITGLWQVSGRSETGFDEYTRLDLYYVDNWSLTADLRILARTASAVVRSSGAY